MSRDVGYGEQSKTSGQQRAQLNHQKEIGKIWHSLSCPLDSINI